MRRAIGAAWVLAIASLGSAVSDGAVLVEYGFGPNHTNKKATPDLTDSSVTATSITWPGTVNGNSGGPMDPTWDGNGKAPNAPGAGNVLSLGNWSSAGYTNNAYIQFTLNANGAPMNLQSLVFDIGINGGSFNNEWFYVNTSVDGGWDLAHAIKNQKIISGMNANGNLNFDHVSVDLSAAQYQNLNSVTFRVYYDEKAQANGVAYDNISVTGAVPEPAAMSLLALGGLLGLRRRRR